MNVPIFAATVFLLVSTALHAATLPKNDGWVTDLAGLLEPQQEAALEALMESYRQGSSNEIALLTMPDLDGEPIERFALDVARDWGMGKAERHNAALLVVARDERKIRIEVGRGLEGALTDSISGRIIRDVISPELKRGRYYEGLRAGIEAMHAAAGGDYAKIERGPGAKSARNLLPLVFWVVLILLLSRGRRGGCLLPWLAFGGIGHRGRRLPGWQGGGFGGFGGGRGGGGGFGGFGGGGGFSGGGASGSW